MGLFSFAHWGVLTSLSAACMLSFISNFIGIKLAGKNGVATVHLRSSDSQSSTRSAIIPPLIGDFDGNIPDCARGVFLTLHEEDGSGEKNCRGLLIRDDIILTSRECSKLSFTFDFPDDDVGILRATRYTFVSSKRAQMVDPRLGFLVVNHAPHHYHFIDKPTGRTRMFLSHRSRPVVVKGADDHDGSAKIMTCNNHKPMAHNFPVDGELVPLGHLEDVLPSDILWEHLDINTAPVLEDNFHRWWTRSVTRKEEEKTFRRLLEQYEGPRGSISLPSARPKSFISQASAVCEAVDPRGHRQRCFKNYFFRWYHEKPFSGQRFFDWLDYGNGKFLLERNETEKMIIHDEKDLICLKKEFNKKKVKYFNDEERVAHEIYIMPSEDGQELIARYKLTDELVPPSNPDLTLPQHLYMWDLNGTFYIVDEQLAVEKFGRRIHHTTVLAGKPALSAGYAYFGEHGVMERINYSSGHYRPDIAAVSSMYQWMNEGLDAAALNWIGRLKWSTEDCKTYDWDNVKILGYGGAALNRSCHEVTTSPKWTQMEDV